MSKFIMFDTEKFIREVEPRECLWNSSSDSYADRPAKRTAWEEVASIMYRDWHQLKPREKDEKITELMRKWRNVRDNYKREKRQEQYPDKRRKYAYSEILTFLDTACQNNRPSRNNVDHQNDSKDCSSIPDVDTNSLLQVDLEEVDFKDEFSSEVSESNQFQIDSVSLQNTPIYRPAEDLKTTASREFLLSLLPDVISLNERQNMQFRLGVLNLINDIRFSNKFQN